MIVHDVEQRSPEWYALRAGKPTASEFPRLFTSKGEPSKSAPAYARVLAAELYAGRPVDGWEGNAYTERGRELEARAVELYEFARDVETSPVGFITDDTMTAGCSPDRLVENDGLLEVKCLKAENHVAAILYYRQHGRCAPDYVQQTQGQLFICGRAWCDLVFYHPELPLLVIRQEPDPTLFKAIAKEVPAVCRERDEILAALYAHARPIGAAA